MSFGLKKDKKTTTLPPPTFLTQLGVGLTNDSDKVLQRGAHTMKCLQRRLSGVEISRY